MVPCSHLIVPNMHTHQRVTQHSLDKHDSRISFQMVWSTPQLINISLLKLLCTNWWATKLNLWHVIYAQVTKKCQRMINTLRKKNCGQKDQPIHLNDTLLNGLQYRYIMPSLFTKIQWDFCGVQFVLCCFSLKHAQLADFWHYSTLADPPVVKQITGTISIQSSTTSP